MSRAARVLISLLFVGVITVIIDKAFFDRGKENIQFDRSDMSTPEPNNRRIVLVSYFLGGGKYVGESLNQNPDVFYWLEPRPDMNDVTESLVLDHMKSYISKYVPGSKQKEEYIKNLIKIFNCQFQEMDNQFFKFFLSTSVHSRALSKVVQCQGDLEATDLDFCKRRIKEICDSSLIKVINSIDLSAFDTLAWSSLKSADVAIYVIIRDPRAIVTSLLSHLPAPESNASMELALSYTGALCSRMHHDIDRSASANGNWLSYETVVNNPESEHILRNIRQDAVPDQALAWLSRNTRKPTEAVGLDWVNSKEVADGWAKEMDIDFQLAMTRITTTDPCNLVKLDYPANILEWF